MGLAAHSGQASVEERQAPRLWRFLSWLSNWRWEWSLGIDYDYDGEVSGSGIMLRLESPFAHRRFIYRWLAQAEPAWMREQRRDDISDVLLQSLLVRPTGLPIAGGTFQPVEITWAEDRLDG